MRLIYNKNEGVLSPSGEFKFVDNKSTIDPTTNDNISKKYLVKTFWDFLKVIKNERASKKERLYYNFLTDKGIFVIKSSDKGGRKLEALVYYEFENDEIRKLFELLIGSTTSSLTASSVSNNFNWVTTPEVLEIMLVAANLRANGEILFAKRTKLKKNGKVRVYYAPNDELKESLRKLNFVLQRMYDKKNADFQVAYKKGKSVFDNASIHKEKKYVFNIDLKDFYPSCKKELVTKYVSLFFNGAPEKEDLLEYFLDIITIDDGLFIGSPISGCLANTILNRPVAYIKNMCKQYDMEFSVYADDMTFSSDKFITEKFVKSLFAEAFTTYGLDSYFTLNEDKSIGYTGCNRKVTGVSINNNNNVTTSRRYYRILRAMINNLSKGESVNVQKLQGKIAYAVMIDESGKIYRYLKKFEETVRKYNLCSVEKMKELEEKFSEQKGN